MIFRILLLISFLLSIASIGFAVPSAPPQAGVTSAQLTTHESDTSSVHGISDTTAIDPDQLASDTTDDNLVDDAILDTTVTLWVEQAASLGDSGTLTPTAGYEQVFVNLTCTADPSGIVLTEGGSEVDNSVVTIVNVGSNTCTFAYASGVFEHNGGSGESVLLEQGQSLILKYETDRWYQVGGHNSSFYYSTITINDYDFIPIEWAEDGSTAPAAAAAITGTTRFVGRAFDGAANEDVTFVWKVPEDFTGTTVTASVSSIVSNATAPANTEVVAFDLAVGCYTDSELSTIATGTGQTSSLTADATYAQYDGLDTAYSSAITPGGSIAAGETCVIDLTRLATTTDTYAQDIDVIGINVKYQRALTSD